MTACAPPEQGQLVEVRQRRYIVAEVGRSTLPPDPLAAEGALQHLVSLSSVEDDALGEELQVIWELEPGARVHERAALPAPPPFDDPRRFDAFLDAVRWGAIASADSRRLQSPFRSGVEIEDYQLDPVVRALQMPRVSLLIADDVGLGKTIEAGLTTLELILRHRARTILVVCPASLQIQWRDQMHEKFGLDFRVVDSELMRDLRRSRGIHVNPWTHFPRLITSIDFLKREGPLRRFRETLPAEGEPAYPRRYDLLIIDEAHNIAPPGAGRFATDSLRTHAMRVLTPHFEHKLFLSATPHNGYPESFSALLELLDNQRFARGIRADLEQLRAVMVRRLKSELPPRWDGTPRFPTRRIEPIEVAYSEAERRAHVALRRYSSLRQRSAHDEAERYANEFVLKLLKKRLFSSPAAFELTLAQHERTLSGARRTAARPAAAILRRQLDQIEDDFADDEGFEESAGDAVEAASRLFQELSAEERALLDELRDWAAHAAQRPDAKAAELIRWLGTTLRPNGPWNSERVIIFTEYRATQKWLQTLLATEGLGSGERLLTLYGGMDTAQREQIKAAFQADPVVSPVRILLATDAASEGIDLQNHCVRLIHYEIPWNPNRLEQRNGRIDRHGQRAPEVLIYHFVGAGYRARLRGSTAPAGQLEDDLEFLMRAALKVDQIREDLGKVGPVIARQVEEAMLGHRSRLETETAEREAEPVRRLLRFERQVREQIARMHEQLQETRQELRLSPERVQAAVQIALALAGQPLLTEERLDGRRVFRLPQLRGSWAPCGEGLAHPHTGVIRPLTFDHDVARGRDDVVLAHLNHRLVQMSLRLLRAEIWSPEGTKQLSRVTARLVPRDLLDAPVAVAHGRLVVTGGDSQRLHEELIVAGGALREGRFARLSVGQTQAALDAGRQAEPPAAVTDRLAQLWPRIAGPLLQALEARMRERTGGLERALAERAEKETADVQAILTELRRSIEAELAEPEFRQLELFSSPEREQFERNVDSLRARLRQIPAEIEQEASAIRSRYATIEPRLFPVAVTFLVPEGLT